MQKKASEHDDTLYFNSVCERERVKAGNTL